MNSRLEFLLLLLFLLGVLFEVVIPIIFGRQLFPHFRKSTWVERSANRAARRLEQARVTLEAAQLEAEAKKIENEAQKLNQQ